jgi:hypothetical protein
MMSELKERIETTVKLMLVFPEYLKDVDSAKLQQLIDVMSFELLDRDMGASDE